MKYEKMKHAAERITMPEEMKRRMIYSCRTEIMNTERENKMKRYTMFFKKPAAVFAALALCLSLSATALAGTDILQGYFKDIINFHGAITGQTYEQATDEIGMEAVVKEDELQVQVVFFKPEQLPYREEEKLSIGEYKITDVNGKVVQTGEETDFSAIVDGSAIISIPLEERSSGSYKLIVSSFVGAKKADQNLKMQGHWTLDFTLDS